MVANKRSKVAIVGLGTVGSGVAEILTKHADRVARHAGHPLELAHVVVRDRNKPLRYELAPDIISDELDQLVNDREIKVVAQLIGGLEPARTIMLRLLESGKDIVTANKALLAEHGPELFDRARELGRSIAFEAAVAGGVPIITNLSQCLSANQVVSLRGILNGTSNFIVSQMEEHGQDYEAAVRLAQDKGFAEADPTMDVDGTDAVQKLSILSHLAYGVHVDWHQIPKTGIDHLQTCDIELARELKYRIKLLAVAEWIEGEGLDLHVSPTLVRIGTPLAEVRGANNAIEVVGDTVGRVFFQGLGAGRLPTASAVVADIIDTAVGRTGLTFNTLDLWSPNRPHATLAGSDESPGRFYMRFDVVDHPGVIAQITGVLGENQISISSIIQPEPNDEAQGQSAGNDGSVSLVIMTHTTTEARVEAATREINQLQAVGSPGVRMRVLD